MTHRWIINCIATGNFACRIMWNSKYMRLVYTSPAITCFFSCSKSHILSLEAVYLWIIYVYLMLTQWVRSCVRRQSSQAAFLSAAAAGSLTCAIRIQPPKCCESGRKREKKREKRKRLKNGRTLRGEERKGEERAAVCGRLLLQLTRLLIGWPLHKPGSPSALEEKKQRVCMCSPECMEKCIYSSSFRL